MIQIAKRNGTKEPFNFDKIITAVSKAQAATANTNINLPLEIADLVERALLEEGTTLSTVSHIHTLVENSLMDSKEHDVAREYITYRKEHMPDIFRERETILPYEYPEVMLLVDALHDSPWNHRHFNYDSDVAYYNSPNTPRLHKTVYARSQLAISQIEVAVKSYWKNVDQVFPKHEFSMLAACFDNSEAIHFNTYKEGLERIGLIDMFNRLDEYPVLAERSKALQTAIKVPSSSRKDILLKNIMFSSFIENVSLMSQFLSISAFDKHLKQYNGMTNGIKATA